MNRCRVILIFGVLVSGLSSTATATWWFGWADKFIVGGLSSQVYGDCSNLTRAYAFFQQNAVHETWAYVGTQAVASKSSAVAKVGYRIADHGTSCGSHEVVMTRYRTSPNSDAVCGDKSGQVYEDSASKAFNTCQWGSGDWTDNVDWTPLELSHSASQPTAGTDGYYHIAAYSNFSNLGCGGMNHAWAHSCYRIYWQ